MSKGKKEFVPGMLVCHANDKPSVDVKFEVGYLNIQLEERTEIKVEIWMNYTYSWFLKSKPLAKSPEVPVLEQANFE